MVNNKIYIGCHKTEDLEDDYMGSGKILKRSIKKYGIENFSKKYLHIFDNPEEMFEMELKLVNDDFITEASNYNLKIGGEGGISEQCLKMASIINKRRLTGLSFDLRYGVETSKNIKDKISFKLNDFYKNGGDNGFKGKTHTDETKRKIGKSNSIHQQGKKNSQYGMMWIYNKQLKESKRIKKNSIIPDGWVKGRKMFKTVGKPC